MFTSPATFWLGGWSGSGLVVGGRGLQQLASSSSVGGGAAKPGARGTVMYIHAQDALGGAALYLPDAGGQVGTPRCITVPPQD